jgi:hypothetical protein
MARLSKRETVHTLFKLLYYFPFIYNVVKLRSARSTLLRDPEVAHGPADDRTKHGSDRATADPVQ